MSFFSNLLGLDIGIDLGTTNIVVYVKGKGKGKGIALNEPSMVALRKNLVEAGRKL